MNESAALIPRAHLHLDLHHGGQVNQTQVRPSRVHSSQVGHVQSPVEFSVQVRGDPGWWSSSLTDRLSRSWG